MSSGPGEATRAAIAALDRDPARPLMLVDADEVLLQFVAALERFFAGRGWRLQLDSFAIHGNVRDTRSGAAIADRDVSDAMAAFFRTAIDTPEPVPGAAEALQALARDADIVVLTNVAADQAAARAAHLARHGIACPVIANSGLKGPAVRALAADARAPVVYVDDIHHHLDDAARHAPAVHLVHFCADIRLRPLMGTPKAAHTRLDGWAAIRAHAEALFRGG